IAASCPGGSRSSPASTTCRLRVLASDSRPHTTARRSPPSCKLDAGLGRGFATRDGSDGGDGDGGGGNGDGGNGDDRGSGGDGGDDGGDGDGRFVASGLRATAVTGAGAGVGSGLAVHATSFFSSAEVGLAGSTCTTRTVPSRCMAAALLERGPLISTSSSAL